jgi:tripartite ATP-independent transporter DctP family solute receptor
MRSKMVISVFVATLAMGVAARGGAAEKVIKFGDAVPKTYSYWPAMEEFKKVVEAKTGGTLKVELFGGGVLGDQKTLMTQTQAGAIQASVFVTTISQALVPEHAVWGLPFLFKDTAAYKKFTYGPFGQELGARLEKHGLKHLTWCYTGFLSIADSKNPIRKPEDLKGHKIRVMEDPMQIATLKALGANAVGMPPAEVYPALKQKVIDGVATGPNFMLTLKANEVAKYLSATEHSATPCLIIMHLAFWNGLSPAEQAAVREAAIVFRDKNDHYHTDQPGTKEKDAYETWQKRGGSVETKIDFQAFRQATKPVIEEWKAKLGADFIERVLKEAGYSN